VRIIRGLFVRSTGRVREELCERAEIVRQAVDISKQEVWEAYLKVRANKGAAGVDGRSIADFEADLKNNLYKIWNRMSSGSYFPPPVKAVEIPKAHGGGVRVLGVPTVADRVAQTVVAARLEERVEPIFHPDSYGYRPGRSALDAVAACRTRCWSSDWVVDLDIQKFFDSVPWDLLVKAVGAHTDLAWVLLYVKRWLAAPLQQPDGELVQRDRGTPQGSAVSPVLANLFLHYAFDVWMARKFPSVQFERYVDDVVVHCVSERQARMLRAAIAERMQRVGLRLHPDKTRLVYCKDGKRRGCYEHTSCAFLGFCFRARGARSRHGQTFTSFLPAISTDALGNISAQVRSWRCASAYRADHGRARATDQPDRAGMDGLLRGVLPHRAVSPPAAHQRYLVRWLRKKYKRLRGFKKAQVCWRRTTKQYPSLFAHWQWVHSFWGPG
jgi:RNA-directed DNA polymerase